MEIISLLLAPGGLALLLAGLLYEWLERKLIARLQNRVGPRWFQPIADVTKLLAKEVIVPAGANQLLFRALPAIALAGVLTAGLTVPLFGLAPLVSFRGDLIVTIYLLSLLTLSKALAGALTRDRFVLVGAMRALTQFFAYEAPFLLALLGPALVAGSWQITDIMAAAEGRWLLLSQPVGFVVALVGLMGKLEWPPFDAPHAKTEIVSGALTEYSGADLALWHLSRTVELVVGLTLLAAFFLGGFGQGALAPLAFLVKTLALLFVLAGIQVLATRLRIDQVAGLWWRYGALLALGQWLLLLVWL